ncbi:MAG: GntR family transcriptional regulator [Galactobacter sp.]
MQSQPRVSFDEVFVPVDHNLRIPLYLQVVSQIDGAIRGGRLHAGTFLPPEPVLQDGFTVARSTIRRALSDLQTRGRISRIRGRSGGTRVEANTTLERHVGSFETLYGSIEATARSPKTRIVAVEEQTVDADFARISRFPVGSRVLHLRRYRSADTDPIAVMENWILLDHVHFDVSRLERESMDQVLRASGVAVDVIDFDIRPVLAGDHAGFLELDPATPIINEVRWVHDGTGLYEYSHLFSHPENQRLTGVIR